MCKKLKILRTRGCYNLADGRKSASDEYGTSKKMSYN